MSSADHPAAAWLLPALLLAATVAVLAAAYASQYLGGLQPCQLCLYQRYPHMAVIALAAAALAVGADSPLRTVAMALAGAVLLGGAGLAGYHVGVEQGVFEGLASCGGVSSSGASLDELREQLLAAEPVRCDEVAWSLFGISMAGYNGIVSLLLAGLAFLGAPPRRSKRRFG